MKMKIQFKKKVLLDYEVSSQVYVMLTQLQLEFQTAELISQRLNRAEGFKEQIAQWYLKDEQFARMDLFVKDEGANLSLFAELASEIFTCVAILSDRTMACYGADKKLVYKGEQDGECIIVD